MTGDPTRGIHRQSEEQFDYEYNPPDPTVAEHENEESLSYEEWSALLDFSMDDETQGFSFNENLNRTSRYYNYIPFEASNQITNILTMCSLEQKELYQSSGLSCTNLRNIIITIFFRQLSSIQFQ